MKFTLAFQIYNKEKTIKSVLESWIVNASGKYNYEYILVFDDCKDKSEEIAVKVLKKYKQKYNILYADNKYEIYCNNLALTQATGDYIIFIQDDNWIYTKNWDYEIVKLLKKVPQAGMISLLAGVECQYIPDDILTRVKLLTKRISPYQLMNYKRIEKKTLHKKQIVSSYNVRSHAWYVDCAIRPFCIKRTLLTHFNGLDTDYSPSCGDDMDLSLKLLKINKKNIYLPLDLVNTTASSKTMTSEFIQTLYLNAYNTLYSKHKEFINIILVKNPNRIKEI